MPETKVIKTTCGICGFGCPVDAHVRDGRLTAVEGSKDLPMQTGRLCAKGLAAKQFLYHKDRVRYPLKRVGKKGEGKFERITWEEAYDEIAHQLLHIRKEYGAKATVFYAGYPKWFRPALLRLSNAYGSPNFCTESSTCFQAAALAWRSLYGNAICPPDLAHANTVLVWSSNLYHSNTPAAGMYQQLKKRGTTIISVDPRHTVTNHEADLHLMLRPGTDGALALAMAHVIIEEHLYNKEFVDQYVYGFEEYREYVRQFTPEKAEKITDVPAEQIRLAASLYAGNGSAAIMFSASAVVHHINGVQNYRAVFALCAITGNYDVEGGNCECAGVSAPIREYGKVKRYDKEEAIGQREFPAWFDLSCNEAQCTRLADYILEEKPYPLKGLFAMGLNHRMWPKPDRLKRALEKLSFYVNTELFLSDSSDAADLVLPACTTYEREEIRLPKAGRFFLSNRAVDPVGESKNDIEIIMEVCRRMQLSDDVLLQGYEAYMQYLIEPAGLHLQQLRESKEGLMGKYITEPSFCNYEKKPFQTPSGKIELASIVLGTYKDSHGYDALPVYRDYREETSVDQNKYPLVLSTGCRKPQYFHARVNRLSWLSGLQEATLAELHPTDGKRFGIGDGDRVRVQSPAGEIEGIAVYHAGIRAGMVCIYHGNAKGEANELIDQNYLDPISGFPGYKSYFCRIERLEGK